MKEKLLRGEWTGVARWAIVTTEMEERERSFLVKRKTDHESL
jgi:hypothetical protein